MVLLKEQENDEVKLYCKSSNVYVVKYNLSSKTLYVYFSSGRVYKYEKVPRHLFLEIEKAPSKGKAIIDNFVKKGIGKYIYNEEFYGILEDKTLLELKEKLKKLSDDHLSQ
jgi:hypothetical protein